MASVYACIGGDPGDLVANDPTAANAPFRFKYVAGGWAARAAYVPRQGETLILIGNSQAVEAATGMPVTAQVGPNPAAQAISTAAGAAAVYGAPIVIALPCPASIAKADVGTAVKNNAGVIAKVAATSDTPFGILRAVPDAGVANALAEVTVQGPCVMLTAAGVTFGDRLVMDAAGKAKTAVAADFITTAAALNNPCTGSRALGMSLQTVGAGLSFLGTFNGGGGLAFLT